MRRCKPFRRWLVVSSLSFFSFFFFGGGSLHDLSISNRGGLEGDGVIFVVFVTILILELLLGRKEQVNAAAMLRF